MKQLSRLFVYMALGLMSNSANAQRYLQPMFGQIVESAVPYGESISWNGNSAPLLLDVYMPAGDTATRRPLLLLFHGGSFVGGSRTDGYMQNMCAYFATRGYVAASVGYRLGVNVGNVAGLQDEFIRAAIRATHDAKAAARFFRKSFVENNNPYGIDTARIFAGGYSAGAITAVHLAWLKNPALTSQQVQNNLAALNAGLEGMSGNPGYHSGVEAVVNLAGAALDTLIIQPGHVPAIHFHGTDDQTVPYARGPVRAMGLNILTVDGSSIVHQRLSNLQINSEMNTFQGGGHDLVSDTARWNFILDRSKLFLYARIGGGTSHIKEQINTTVRCFPNPTTDWLQIEGFSPTVLVGAPWTYALLDLSGRWVRPFSTLSQDGRITLGDLSSGHYFLILRQKDQTSYHRIIKN
jgi:poly(3-hydroxybutyrate) depolymerase